MHMYTRALVPIWQPSVGDIRFSKLDSPNSRLTRIAAMHGAIRNHANGKSRCNIIGATSTGKLATGRSRRKVFPIDPVGVGLLDQSSS